MAKAKPKTKPRREAPSPAGLVLDPVELLLARVDAVLREPLDEGQRATLRRHFSELTKGNAVQELCRVLDELKQRGMSATLVQSGGLVVQLHQLPTKLGKLDPDNVDADDPLFDGVR